jgi:pyridoxamine 5'-phosphate oxidase
MNFQASPPPLTAEGLGPDPIRAFQSWFDHIREAHSLPFPDAVCLGTVDPEGWPEGRMVLLKGVDERGFHVFTNYRSAKGKALEANPRAALTFYWGDLDRQVRIQGEVDRLSDEESDAYFASRPRGSRIGAWASDQSAPLESREALEARVEEVVQRYGDGPIPRPPHWGGYLIRPRTVEFWQGREDRLHDRILYRRGADGNWTTERLNP